MSRAVTSESVCVRIDELRNRGMSNQQIADSFNTEGVLTEKGGEWTRHAVQNLIAKARRQPPIPMTRELSLEAWGKRPGFNDPYGAKNGRD